MSKNVDQELAALLDSFERPAGMAKRVSELIAKGASLHPAEGIPPLFLAIHRLNAPVVQALLTAGASLDAPLTSDWTEFDDEGERVICPAGTSARAFFSRIEKQERKGRLVAKRAKWLEEVAALVGSVAAKSPKAPAKKSTNGETTPTLEGHWVEVRRSSGARSAAVKNGAELVITAKGFTVKGSLAVGLPKKGLLTERSERAASYVDDDLVWKLALSGDALIVTSPAEADEEHGLVHTATFERMAK